VTIKLALNGATGRMGREIIAALRDDPRFELVAAIGREAGPDAGRDIGAVAGGGSLGVSLASDVSAAVQSADVLIDFSNPAGFAAALAACREANCAFVSGTTGLSEADQAAIEAAARAIAVMHAPNMSLGMAVLNRLAGEAARLLGEDFDVEILELHHRHKKDAPSGSALHLGEIVAGARGTTLAASAAYGRHGNVPRAAGTIGFASLRAGDAAGEHTVLFGGDGERVELIHRATTRRIFARGALRAAAWIADRPVGRYRFQDLLNG
jgi:4-hydroxy-tetrahydrodipicolinate reductase